MADTEIGIAVGITTLPHLRNLAVVGPHRVTGVSDTAEPPRRSSPAGPPAQPTRRRAPRASCAAWPTTAFRRAPTRRARSAGCCASTRAGRRDRNFEARRDQGGRSDPGQPAVPVPARGHAGRRRGPGSRTGWPTSNWRRGCRSSCGAPARTRCCSTLATQGKLTRRRRSSRQVTRLLADPRAEALATRFASQWLRLQDLDDVSPDPILYPYYDRTLAQALQKETELFVASLVRDDRSVLDLLTADYTYVNDRVARHYGIAGVTGPQFRRVTLPEPRRGILGHGSVLTLTSIADRTSPVQRGKWIMEVLLGSPPPPPPPNVPALEETKGTSDGKVLSVRERMEEHRKNPACTSCHKVIDPLGLALEHFDATGRYRIKDNERAGGRGRRPLRRHADGGRRRAARGAAEAQGRVPAQLHRAPDDLRARPPRRAVGHAGGARR